MVISTRTEVENIQDREIEVRKTTLDLLDKIWTKIGSAKQANSLIAGITRMTRHALNASASSLFLIDEDNQELLLKFASGFIGKPKRNFLIDGQAGITGWVARSGKPLVVNNVDKDPRLYRFANKVYGFAAKSIICAPLIVHRKIIGVIEVANKVGRVDFNNHDLQTLIGVASTIALAIENVRLNECLQDYYKSTVNALVSLADAKETAGRGHSKRVSEYALMAATNLSLSREHKQTIEYASVLHDIGKLAIPDRILNKSDRPTDEEWKIIRRHPEIGYNLLREIPFLVEASLLILYHHERYDGKGYPCGLKGEAIPIGARLIAVADAFDNMTIEHPYHNALDNKQAFVELNKNIRSQFCPLALRAFIIGFSTKTVTSLK